MRTALGYGGPIFVSVWFVIGQTDGWAVCDRAIRPFACKRANLLLCVSRLDQIIQTYHIYFGCRVTSPPQCTWPATPDGPSPSPFNKASFTLSSSRHCYIFWQTACQQPTRRPITYPSPIVQNSQRVACFFFFCTK